VNVTDHSNDLPSDLPRAVPEDVGVSSAKLAAFVEALSSIRDPHSLVVVKNGRVICEAAWDPYRLDERHTLFSLSKSFASTAIGLAVDEGRLTVDDLVVEHFANDLPSTVDANLAKLRVRHLLSMSTGHETDATPRYDESNWSRAFLGRPIAHEPGTVFTYNSGATYMLSALIQKISGHTLLEYLRPRLLDPLGIADATWASNSEGINVGGWGLTMNTRDIAKFGQLFAQEGRWGDQQIVPKAWTREATRSHIDNSPRSSDVDWQQGYGFQFWRCQHGFYRGDGAFGQYCVVMPELNAVLAMNSGVGPMQPPLDVVWEYLIPALEETESSPDLVGNAKLNDVCRSRSLPIYADDSDEAQQPFEDLDVIVALEANRGEYARLTVRRAASETTLRFDDVVLVVGHDQWVDQHTTFTSFADMHLHVRAKGIWITATELQARMVYVGEPFTFDFTLTVRNDDKRLELIGAPNVSFMDPPPQNRFAGTIAN
jgi:CubicO group peptidase (beta-lactamase class C family)